VTGFLTRNIGWKLLSLGAAVVLWITVASEPEVATLRSVPVEYKSMPQNLEISSSVVESVFLEMRGSSGRLRDVADAKSAVVLDFSGVHQAGERTFTIDRNTANLPRGIDLVRAIPAQLRFRFEPRASRRVPVEVRFSPPHEGYAVASYHVEPEDLAVVGPESSVEKTQSVVTDPIDIGGVVNHAQFRVNTYLSEPRVRFQASSHVVVQVTVKKK
jgi:YbbR domain-containing protein